MPTIHDDRNLSSTLADVFIAASDVVCNRTEALRQRLQREARSVLSALVYTCTTVALIAVAMISASAALIETLLIWIPASGAYAILALTALSGAGITTIIAKNRLASSHHLAMKEEFRKALDEANSPIK